MGNIPLILSYWVIDSYIIFRRLYLTHLFFREKNVGYTRSSDQCNLSNFGSVPSEARATSDGTYPQTDRQTDQHTCYYLSIILKIYSKVNVNWKKKNFIKPNLWIFKLIEYTMLYIFFQYGWEPVEIHRLLIEFEAILKNRKIDRQTHDYTDI